MRGKLADASCNKGQHSASFLYGKKHSAVKSDSLVYEKRTIYIWDMDETLILLQSLLNGTYGGAFNGSKDIKRGFELGKCWAKHILQVCDNFFFYEQVLLSLSAYVYLKLCKNFLIMYGSQVVVLYWSRLGSSMSHIFIV